MTEVLYGIHDEEAVAVLRKGHWCVGLVALKDAPSGKRYPPTLNWIIRVGWGYEGAGTLPDASLGGFLANLRAFASTCKGATRYVIGNEPNHPQEWPNGKQITASAYANAFVESYKALKAIDSSLQVYTGAIAPYREGWREYLKEVLDKIKAAGVTPDGFTVHAYLRSADPNQVADENLKMQDGSLAGTYAGFLTYRDALAQIPTEWHKIPAYITEIDEDLPDGWVNQNTGVVKAVYEEINRWNHVPGNQQIGAGILFRWPHFDKWYIEGKQGVVTDFLEASLKGYTPVNSTFSGGSGVILPQIKNEAPTGQNSTSEPILDPRAKARGVTIEEKPGTEWEVKSVRWIDKAESQGRHHIFYDTLDEAGNRVVGVPITIKWPSGNYTTHSEEKKGEKYSANFPMDSSRNDYSTWVGSSATVINSDVVSGIGMGADLGGGFNASEHTSTEVILQKRVAKSAPVEPSEPVQTPKFELIWPVGTAEISQRFGENAVDYSGITDSGVPLRGHTGIDFAVPAGTPVKAAADGQVIEMSLDPNNPTGFGKYVKLGHSFGETLYGHLDNVFVSPSSKVVAGQSLGLSGATGNATGPHLHFGLRINPYNRADGWGGYSDPLPYFQGNSLPEEDANVLDAIRKAADEVGIDWELLSSLAWAESSFRPGIEGGGLTQVTLDVWTKYGTGNIQDPYSNAKAGASYLKDLIEYYGGDVRKAVLAYNFGPGNVDSGANPPLNTAIYREKVIHGRDLLKAVGE